MKSIFNRYLGPAAALQILLLLIPTGIIAAYSLMSRGAYGGVAKPWTLENYARLLDPLYGAILLRSVGLATIATVLCLVLAFPLALFISRSGKRKNLYLQLVILPFWTSFLIRTYAWIFLLRDSGLFNSALIATGIIREPLPLLYNNAAVILGLVYGYLPFAVLPLYAALERVDKNLVEAAADLGATPRATLYRIVVPLVQPGIWAAGLLVFIPCVGAYLTPDLMGGGKTIMIGNLVQNQFTAARDWPFGSAAALVLMALVMFLLTGAVKRGGQDML